MSNERVELADKVIAEARALRIAAFANDGMFFDRISNIKDLVREAQAMAAVCPKCHIKPNLFGGCDCF